MQQHGWTLLFHDCIIEQLQKLHRAARRAERNDPVNASANANVKLFHALSHLMLTVIPADPAKDDYRQGNTLDPRHRHWRRAKIGRRFRLFFRYDTRSRIIIYACIAKYASKVIPPERTPEEIDALFLGKGELRKPETVSDPLKRQVLERLRQKYGYTD